MAPEILLPSTGESFEFDGVAEIRGLALGSYVWGSTSFGWLWGLFSATKSCGGILPRSLPYNHDKVHLIIRRNTTDTPAQSYGR